jgi:hypothetical protein
VGGDKYPRVVQEGRDGDEEVGYIENIQNTATAGFKYFDCKGVREIAITTRGYAGGIFEVRNKWDGECLAEIRINYSNVWERYITNIPMPDGVQAIYLTYKGEGNAALKSFELI